MPSGVRGRGRGPGSAIGHRPPAAGGGVARWARAPGAVRSVSRGGSISWDRSRTSCLRRASPLPSSFARRGRSSAGSGGANRGGGATRRTRRGRRRAGARRGAGARRRSPLRARTGGAARGSGRAAPRRARTLPSRPSTFGSASSSTGTPSTTATPRSRSTSRARTWSGGYTSTDEQRRKLAAGELALVGFRRRHHVVPAGVADEIQALRPIVFVHRAAGAGGDAPAGEAGPAEDDPYRDFPVPDDLHW